MSDKLMTLSPDTDVADAAMMFENHANRLPVTADGRPVGTVSRTDSIRLTRLEEDQSAGGLAPAE